MNNFFSRVAVPSTWFELSLSQKVRPVIVSLSRSGPWCMHDPCAPSTAYTVAPRSDFNVSCSPGWIRCLLQVAQTFSHNISRWSGADLLQLAANIYDLYSVRTARIGGKKMLRQVTSDICSWCYILAIFQCMNLVHDHVFMWKIN